jgi:hypothetical protein
LAEHYVDQLQSCADENSLMFWQSWARLYRHALDLRRGGASAAAGAGQGWHVSQIDMAATLHPDLVSDEAVVRAAARLNAWCAPEVMRVVAQRALATLGAEAAKKQLQEALALANAQGAPAWALRCALSLARMAGPERSDLAGSLSSALAACEANGPTRDTREAGNLLAAWGVEAAAAGT